MRTTLNIDDDLYRDIKVEAARRGFSITRVIEEALRASLHSADIARPDFPMSSRSGRCRSPSLTVFLPDVYVIVASLRSDHPHH